MKSEFRAAIDDVLERSSFILGPQVVEFEQAFAKYIGTSYCAGVGSGTAALKVALEALGIGNGDEVILPANTFIASAIAVSAVGAVPVLVDMDEAYLIDADAIERAISTRTKAIMPVHLYGQVAPMGPILELARRYGLRVVEDAAQAHGAVWQSARAGSIGDVGCFSFYPSKNLGCFGDGGAIVTNDESLCERAKLLRDLGQKRKYEHLIKGDNCRLDSIQAAVLGVKLRYIDTWNEKRRKNAALYDQLLARGGFATPKCRTKEGHVYHLYVTRVNARNEVQGRLRERGIQTAVHYPIPLHLQPAYAELGCGKGSYPKSESAAAEILSLPMFPELSEDQIRFTVDALTEVGRPARETTHA
ncbi:MAG: DegT/DnrJ/EryC1/StrS family aminotransferase [Candidatus Eremiobacteraeota bacterium]|nr:DegT/DnrJ/EryC1/StrS family aminotransferase [Candidatus Eremiobacteraeota bacterium]